MRSASATSSFSSPQRSRPNSTATFSPAATCGASNGGASLRTDHRLGLVVRARGGGQHQRAVGDRRLDRVVERRHRRERGRRPTPSARAWTLGQPSRGLTRRSRDSPKFAITRAAAPMFSPSCGSTRMTIGAGSTTQSFVLSVPAPGIRKGPSANIDAATANELAPHRPLPRLRGRDREGARTGIRASSPPPQPSPASGGGSHARVRRRPHLQNTSTSSMSWMSASAAIGAR